MKLLVLYLVFWMFPAAATADAITWRDNVRGWYIGVDTSVDSGCYMTTSFEEGTVLRAAINPALETFDFFVGDERWQSIESGKFYQLSVQFDSLEPWSGDSFGFRWNGTPYIGTRFSLNSDEAGNFVDQFMTRTSVSIRYEGRPVANLSLRGTYAAMLETFECQSAMSEGSGSERSDPFSEGTSPGSEDPFR